VGIHSERVYRLPISRTGLWRAITGLDDYQLWWPWLRRFEAAGLKAGDVWLCTLRPPLPYRIRCEVRLQEVREPELVAADLSGDLAGRARIELQEADAEGAACTDVRIVSDLVARAASIRLWHRLCPSLSRRAHDWVLDTGAHQFATAVTSGLPKLLRFGTKSVPNRSNFKGG
jgi:hypothetical protein